MPGPCETYGMARTIASGSCVSVTPGIVICSMGSWSLVAQVSDFWGGFVGFMGLGPNASEAG